MSKIKQPLKKSLMLSMLMLLMPLSLLAQNIKVQGVVKDQSGETVIGATVTQKGTSNATVTDIDGNFTLSVPTNSTLTISYIGYASQEVAVNGKTTFDIVLKDDSQLLNEVVVVGYGTMDKKELTSAISHVGEKDFLTVSSLDPSIWYEDGKDRGQGVVGRGYGRAAYARALAYIAESAKKYGIFTSLVMPHLFNDAEVEARYGNMVRIVADTGDGGWRHTSAHDKGKAYASWPNCMNQYDGFLYWSHITGRDKVILDGDFLRLNKYDNDAERQTAVSLQIMAGGPVAVADQPSTIGSNLTFYTNSELIQLRKDGFVGQPLNAKLGESGNEVWYGTMQNGDYVVGLFNRSDQAQTLSVNLSQLGIDGEKNVRDLWTHTDEGNAATVSASVPAHGCKIVRLTNS